MIKEEKIKQTVYDCAISIQVDGIKLYLIRGKKNGSIGAIGSELKGFIEDDCEIRTNFIIQDYAKERYFLKTNNSATELLCLVGSGQTDRVLPFVWPVGEPERYNYHYCIDLVKKTIVITVNFFMEDDEYQDVHKYTFDDYLALDCLRVQRVVDTLRKNMEEKCLIQSYFDLLNPAELTMLRNMGVSKDWISPDQDVDEMDDE